MSALPNVLVTGVWPKGPSKITTSAQTTRITRPMKQRPNSRIPVTTVRSAAGTSSSMSVCTRTNIQSYKVWSNMDTPASTSTPKSGTCWMGSRLMNWTLPRGKYGPPLCYRPTLTTVSRYSRISSTIRRRPPQGPPPLHPLGPRGHPTIVNKTTLNPTCLWMTVTTRARNTPSCPRPRNSVSSLSAKDVVTSRVIRATTSQVTQETRAGPG